MRTLWVLVAMAWSAVACAQTPPPTVGGKPLLQVKPRGQATSRAAPAKPQPIATRLQACLDIEDGSKGRLECFDAIVPPKTLPPKQKPKAAKAVADCKFVKEEDERLTCFNGFAESLPRLPQS